MISPAIRSTFVRSANLAADEQLIINFLAENHISDSNQKRFNWLYRNGPAGPAQAWISCDSESRATIGVAAAFPRTMWVQGKEKIGWVLGDFCIASQYRSLGPAMQLQRSCLADLQSGGDVIYYDFPSPTMAAVYRRLGIIPQQQLVRLAKPLRVDRRVHRLIKQPQIARVVASVANAVLALRSNTAQMHPDVSVSMHDGACGSEFTDLSSQLGLAMPTCLQRSAGYLNWRYRDHPYRLHEIVVLRRAGTLLGFAVLFQESPHLSLVDLSGTSEAISELIRGVISIAATRKLETITVGILASHPWTKIFSAMGYHHREQLPVVIRCSNGNPQATYGETGDWFLMNGDRES